MSGRSIEEQQAVEGDAALGELDHYLIDQKQQWERKADELRRELGPRFLNGSPEQRAAMVRDWTRNFRARGDLPPGRPPGYTR